MSITVLARVYLTPRFLSTKYVNHYLGFHAPELLGAKAPQKSQNSSPFQLLSPGVSDPAHFLDWAVCERWQVHLCTSVTFSSYGFCLTT